MMPHEPRIQGLRRWLRIPRPIARDVNDEIAFHLESRTRELMRRGYSADRARVMAETEFGDIAASRRELIAVDRHRRRRERLARWIETAIQDLRHAARSLRRSPAFTITAGLTLVVGIGACVAIFAAVNGVLLRPLPYGHADRLVGAWHDMPSIGLTHQPQSASTYFTYQRLAHTIDGIGVYDEGAVNVSEPGGDSEPQRVTCAYVSATLIPLLEVRPIRGRSFTGDEDRPDGEPVMIISERMWRTRFAGAPNILERSLSVNGASRRIVGVMPERFRFPATATDAWLPLALDPVKLDAKAFSHSAIARLKAGVNVADAQHDFASLLPRVADLFPRFVPGISTRAIMEQAKPIPVLVPLRDDITGGIAATLWTVAAAAALVLLVACANVANLTLVRADARQRELVVREALGAGRARVALGFFAESALLAGVAGVIGLGFATMAVRWLVTAGPVGIPRLTEVRIDSSALLFMVALAALVAALSGVVPALRMVRNNRPLGDRNRSGTAGRAQHRLRATLAIAQIALALVALAGSGLLLRTFDRLHAVRPGFDPEHLTTFWVSLPRARYGDSAVVRFSSALTERVGRLPGVKSVGMTSRLPLEPYGIDPNPIYPEDDASYASKLPPLQLFSTVNGDYFRAMGIPLIAGRTFDQLSVQREGEAVISQTTAKYFWKDSTGRAALGKRFRPLPNARWYTVIGVVGDARDTALAVPPSPTVYFPQVVSTDPVNKQVRRTIALAVRTAGDPAAINETAQRIVRDLDPSLPTFDAKPMTAALSLSTARLTFTVIMLGSAAVVTLLLGTVGLYGVLAYLVTLRTRELGIRIALGATPREVAAAMTRNGIGLACAGIAAGLVIFAFVARFLRAVLFGVTPSDPLTLVAACLTLVTIASAASWIPARRAARVDPADTLRAE